MDMYREYRTCHGIREVNHMDFGKLIHEKALEYGYDNCGVISLEASDEELIEKVIPRSEYHLAEEQTDVLRTGAKRVLTITK